MRCGVVPSCLSAHQGRGASEDGAGAGAVVEVETSLRPAPPLPPHHLLPLPRLGTVSPVTERDPVEVPGAAGAVDQARPPAPVAPVAAVLVD